MAEEPPTRSRHEWEVSAPPDDVNTVLNALRRIWDHGPPVPAVDRSAIETALVELTGNVIEHAAAGTPDLVCHVAVTVDAAAVRVEVRDAGAAVAVDLAEAAMPGDTAESGRGIPMITALVDEFTYERVHDVNHWRLLRRVRAERE